VYEINDVRRFWDSNPLFSGESAKAVGSKEFFEHHSDVYYRDVFAGRLDDRLFSGRLDGSVLDLGCGIGFWLVELWKRGARDIIGVDISAVSAALAKTRCNLYGVKAKLMVGNAENLPLHDNSFDHINCQGVIHHTPRPEQAVFEICRILRPGGSALISVYYKNIVLSGWPLLRHLVRFLPIGLSGRGRDRLSSMKTVDDLVRYYDGADNPIGKCYSKDDFISLLRPLVVKDVFYHFFPARALPVRIPGFLHRRTERVIPFMIFANVIKPADL